jgi:rfaE bifunctional protein kinase chain/domain
MNLTEVFRSFQNMKVAIIGDVMVDAYLKGKVHRMSPEAPVPVLLLNKEENRLGGAANVALNLKALGAQTYLCSVIGKDHAGETLIDLLKDAGIHNHEILFDEQRKTTVKTRVLSGTQHVLRIDQEDLHSLESSMEDALIKAVKHRMDEGLDALIFEDYNKGVLTQRVITELVSYANENGIKTTVDPKNDNFLSYKHVSLFKPNLKELIEGLAVSIDVVNRPESLAEAAKKLREVLNHDLTLITDVSGAGDTVIAVATLCLIANLEPEQIAAIANLAGGMVCEHSGVVSVDSNALLLEANKLS